MIFLNFFQTKRYFFFFYLVFFYFFIYNSFHAITEEVCVSICFVAFSVFLLYFITGKGLVGFQRAWYNNFLKGFDLVLLSLVALHKIFSSVFVAYTKDLYNFFDVYSFFFLFFKLKVSSFMLVDLAVLVNNFQNILVARNMGFSFIKSVKTEGFNTLLSS